MGSLAHDRRAAAVLFILLFSCTSSRSDDPAPEATAAPAELVANVFPGHAEQNVSVGSTLGVTFRDSVEVATLNQDTFFLRRGARKISAKINISGNSAVLVPVEPLGYFTVYVAELTTGIQFVDGQSLEKSHRWIFTTEEDPGPLRLETLTPAPGAKEVDSGTRVVAQFEERLRRSTAAPLALGLLDEQGFTVPGEIAVDGPRLVFTPKEPLEFLATYTAILLPGVKGGSGKLWEGEWEWKFQIRDEPPECSDQSGGQDCNDNGTSDDIDIESGGSLDCNGNCQPDECETAPGADVDETSPSLAPLQTGTILSHTLELGGLSSSDVTLNVEALGDLDYSSEVVDVQVNGSSVGTLFTGNHVQCGVNTDTLVIPEDRWNSLVDGQIPTLEFIPATSVDSICSGTYLQFEILYSGPPSAKDCNRNGIPDECDVAQGIATDCNGNGILDSCELQTGNEASYSSDQLGPLEYGTDPEWTFPAPQPAGKDFTIQLDAFADLNSSSEYVTMELNGVNLGDMFVASTQCGSAQDALLMNASSFNALLAGGDATFRFIPSSAVTPDICSNPWIQVSMTYETRTPLFDCNENGVLDECDISTGASRDDDGNGVPDECDP